MTDIAVKLPVADYIGDELRILDLLIYHAKANKNFKKKLQKVTLLFNLQTNLSLASKTWQLVEAWFDKSRSQQSEESTSMITSTSCPRFWGLSTLNTKFILSSFLPSRNKDKKLQETIINNLEEIRYMIKKF